MLEFNLTLEEMIPLIKKCSDKKLLFKIGYLVESRKKELDKIEANKYLKEIFESFPSKKIVILATIKKDSKAFDGISVSYCSNFPNEYTECSRSEVLVMNDLVGNKKLSNLFEKVRSTYVRQLCYIEKETLDEAGGIIFLTVSRNEI